MHTQDLDIDEVLIEFWVTRDTLLITPHFSLCEFHSGVILSFNHFNGWHVSFPGHCRCEPQDFLFAVKQLAVPVIFQSPPEPFNWVVLAVIWRIVGQPDMESIAVCKVYNTFDELGSMAGVLGAIIHVENQRVDFESFF